MILSAYDDVDLDNDHDYAQHDHGGDVSDEDDLAIHQNTELVPFHCPASVNIHLLTIIIHDPKFSSPLQLKALLTFAFTFTASTFSPSRPLSCIDY